MICGLCGAKSTNPICKKCSKKVTGKNKSVTPISATARAKKAIPDILTILSTATLKKETSGHMSLEEIAKRANITKITAKDALKILRAEKKVTRDAGYKTSMWKLSESEVDINVVVSAILDGNAVVEQLERLLR